MAHQATADSLSIELETLNHVLGLVETFRAFDSDNDGWINAQELRGIMGSLGYNNVTDQDIEAMMQKKAASSPAAAAAGGGGSREGSVGDAVMMSMGEFLSMNTEDLELGGLAVLKTAFDGMGLEEHDLVTGEELYEVVVGSKNNMGVELLTLEDCHDIVASMDGDGDGAITFADFKLIVNSLV